MRPKYLWPVLLGLAAGCSGGADTASGDGAGEGQKSSGAESAAAEDGTGDASASSAAAASSSTETDGAGVPSKAAVVERQAADDFDLNDLDGNGVSLSGLKGKVVLLAFWGID